MISVYGASYFFEDDPETPVIALWGCRGSEEEVREMRIPYVYLGPGDTTWTRLFGGMERLFIDPANWQYATYRNKDPFFHIESSEPILMTEPTDDQ